MLLADASGVLSEGLIQTIYGFTVGYVIVMSVFGTTLMQYSGRIEPLVQRIGN